MRARPFRLRRPALFRERELWSIEHTALRILEEVGIEISHADLAARARSRGFQFQSEHVRLPRRQVSAFIEETRRGRRSHRPHRLPPATEVVRLSLGISTWSAWSGVWTRAILTASSKRTCH